MKKIFTLCMALLFGGSLYAQNHPERMVVVEKTGDYKGFLAERIDSVFFPKVEGKVVANIELKTVNREKITFDVYRSLACPSFKFMVVPEVTAKRLDDAAAASYVDKSSTAIYTDDFVNGEIPATELDPATKYVAITVGLDKYNIPCGVSRAPFTTLQKPLIGNPEVTYKIDTLKTRKLTVTFTPNADVEGYATIIGLKGTMQSQYDQWGPMMNFKNFGDLVKGWGFNDKATATRSWEDLDPDTEYDLFVQAWDKAGTYSDCDTIHIKTLGMGGSGNAAVDITLSDYMLQDWEGQQKYSQFIVFTPNDQSKCFRFSVNLAENYDKDPEGFNDELKQDPPTPDMAHWFFYEKTRTDFQINPGVKAVAIAAAKNADNKWGEVTIKRFTTPTVTKSGVKSTSYTIGKRDFKDKPIQLNLGKAPAFKTSKGIVLTK